MLLPGSTRAQCNGMNRLIICVLFLALVGPVQALLIVDGNTGLASASIPIVDSKIGLTSPDVVIDFGTKVLERFTPVSDQFPGVTFNDALYACCAEHAPAVDQGYLLGLSDTGIGPIVFDDKLSAVAFSWRTNVTGSTTFEAWLDDVMVESFTAATDWGSSSGRYYGFSGIVFDEIRVTILTEDKAFSLDNIQWNVARSGSAAGVAGRPHYRFSRMSLNDFLFAYDNASSLTPDLFASDDGSSPALDPFASDDGSSPAPDPFASDDGSSPATDPFASSDGSSPMTDVFDSDDASSLMTDIFVSDYTFSPTPYVHWWWSSVDGDNSVAEYTTPDLAAVPAPPTIWLIITGLIGLGFTRRRAQS